MLEARITDTTGDTRHRKDIDRHTLLQNMLEASMFHLCTKNQNILLLSTSHQFITQAFMNHQYINNLNIWKKSMCLQYTPQKPIQKTLKLIAAEVKFQEKEFKPTRMEN